MSEFLAPIHHWLYIKIKLVNERLGMLFHVLREWNADKADELEDELNQSLGNSHLRGELQDMIDHTNIHGWLQRQINSTETKEAMVVKQLSMLGPQAKEKTLQVYINHAESCAEQAVNSGKYDISSAAGLYDVVQDYVLSGMPCDQVHLLEEVSPPYLRWKNSRCVHEHNWQRAGIDKNIMHNLYSSWLTHFITSINSDFRLQVTGYEQFEIIKNE